MVRAKAAATSDCREKVTASGDSLATYASNAPVTGERKFNLHLQNQLPKPYLARALVAVDPDHPNGTKGKDHHNMTVLQQHVSFFDRNKDGIVYPWETYQGLRAIGFALIPSIFGSLLVNLFFSYRSQTSWLPNPLLPIYVKNIHKCKHGSDSETYDTEGRFEPSKFDAIFSKYALTNPNAITSKELDTMLQANRNLHDYIGWIMSIVDWKVLYRLGKDEQGLLHRETVRGVYDGSLFEQLEKTRASRS